MSLACLHADISFCYHPLMMNFESGSKPAERYTSDGQKITLRFTEQQMIDAQENCTIRTYTNKRQEQRSIFDSIMGEQS